MTFNTLTVHVCVEIALLLTCLAIDVLCLTIENNVMAAFIDCVLIEYLFCVYV